MYKWIVVAVLAIVIGAGAFAYLRSPREEVATGDPETRIIAYLNKNVTPGQPVLVTKLYNEVFTTPEDREALQRLYDKFFKIPAFCAEVFMRTGNIPTLKQISDEFQLTVPGELNVLFRALESDPRAPKFLDRDPNTGEITHIYVDRIASDERFGKPLRNR
jgi:hypothetical protein